MRGRIRHHGMHSYHYAPPPPPPPPHSIPSRRYNYHHQSQSRHHNSRPPFDIYMVEDFFPKVAPTNEVDNQLNNVSLPLINNNFNWQFLFRQFWHETLI